MRNIINYIILSTMISDAMFMLILNLHLQLDNWGYVRDNDSNDDHNDKVFSFCVSFNMLGSIHTMHI